MDKIKKFFFKEDGTIKVLNMVIVISIIFAVSIIFIYNKFLKSEFEEPNETYKTTTATSSINMCKDCDFYFTLDTLTFNDSKEYKIDSYIEVKNMSINNIKFKDFDNNLISVESGRNGLIIKTKDQVGKTKLIAEYSNIVREIDIEVVADSVKSATLLDHPYYILNNKENDLEIMVSPKGIDLSLLDIKVLDESIAKFQDGKLIGLREGVTELVLNFNGEEQVRELHVYNNLIHVETLSKEKKLVDTYKVSLKEFNDNIYNIVVSLDDFTNYGYTSSDLIITHEDEGLEVYIDYDGKYSLDNPSYKYRITLNGDEGKSVIKFKMGNSERVLIVGE